MAEGRRGEAVGFSGLLGCTLMASPLTSCVQDYAHCVQTRCTKTCDISNGEEISSGLGELAQRAAHRRFKRNAFIYGFNFAFENIVAKLYAFVADAHRGRGDDPCYVILGFAAEGAGIGEPGWLRSIMAPSCGFVSHKCAAQRLSSAARPCRAASAGVNC